MNSASQRNINDLENYQPTAATHQSSVPDDALVAIVDVMDSNGMEGRYGATGTVLA